MANGRLFTNLPKNIYAYSFDQAGIERKDVTQMLGKLSRLSKDLNVFFKPVLNKRALNVLSQAVIDDDRETVKMILDFNPDLLLFEPQNVIPNLVIESKYTWQRFYAENPLTMAVKRKQIEMIELMLPYYERINDKDSAKEAKENSLSAWTCYDTGINDEIMIPEEYTDYLQSLVDVIKKETFPNEKLSEQTETKLTQLFNDLLPEKPVKLDKYFDVELLLLAAYKAVYKAFNNHSLGWQQLDILAIRVIGLIITMQSPEVAKIYCEGLDGVVDQIKKGKKKEISKQAVLYQLKGGEGFYRSSRDSHQGTGFDFLCGLYGVRWEWVDGSALACFGNLMSSKSIRIAKLMQPHQQEQSWCVIC